MSARTSLTHPLIINTIPVAAGALGLTFCPGKKQPNAMTGSWARDIALDIATIKSWGADAVISLLEHFEYEELQVTKLPEIYQREFKVWYDLPIQDKYAPDQHWLDNWLAIRGGICAGLNDGKKIMIHCKGGFGRTGTVAAMILMDFGYSAADAITTCRNARELSVETPAQEQFLMEYSQLLQPGSEL